MEQIHFDLFDEKIVTCTYRDEIYSVREDGSVFRHGRNGTHRRPLDEKWTFGRKNEKKGYMYIASTPVHRIVATAFHGPQPSEKHVVDHIDTNQCNNRPENLRWVTRLENIILNPITRRRIELAYGSIENFLKNPAQPTSGKLDPDFEWMRSVTKQEAEETLRGFLDWAKSGRMPSGGTLGEWNYKSQAEQLVEEPESDILIESRTPNAIQKNWKTPSEFPLCPSDIGADALTDYRKHLKEREVFTRNRYGESIVHSAEFSKNSESLLVLCNNPGGVKEWSLARVSLDDQLFVHESLGTFFTMEGATKQFTLERGLEWEGGDTIDDYS